MKHVLIVGGVLFVLIGVGFVLWKPSAPVQVPLEPVTPGETIEDAVTDSVLEAFVLPLGTYAIKPAESVVGWAGKKPLIDGYVNSGSIAVTIGEIQIAETGMSGSIEIDMNTLSVSGTPAKQGQESALENHLKGERWFDVATYPTATVVLKSATALDPTALPGRYTVVADLTMHGVTAEVQFEAQIMHDSATNQITAQANFEIDRTRWNITAGSGSFFDNLEDNLVDDMVGLTLNIVAEQL